MQSPRKPAPFVNAGIPMNNKYKILLVEDEPSIRKYVNALLNASGYIVIEAANCAEAKPCFLSHTPDLVLLDLGLPDGDGMQLLEFIRSRSAVPVIVLSARSDETDKVVALDGGANDYVTKPFGSAELLARMRSALRTGRQHGNQVKRTGRLASAHSRSIAEPAAFLQAGPKFGSLKRNTICCSCLRKTAAE